MSGYLRGDGGRPAVRWETPPDGAAGPSTAVDKAEDAVEAAEDAVSDAKATGDPKAISAAEARLKAAEDRLAKLEVDFTSHRQAVEGKADREHAHEMPGELKALHESIRDIEAEETPPARKRHWLYRPIGSRG